MNFSKVFIVVLAVWALSGCSTTVKLPEGKSGVTLKEASSAWASVLKNNVDSDGWVNFENVKRNPDALNTYVAFISKNTPKSQ